MVWVCAGGGSVGTTARVARSVEEEFDQKVIFSTNVAEISHIGIFLIQSIDGVAY